MEAELLKELDDETWDAVSTLVSLCNAVDHTSYDTDLDGDFYYIIRNDDPEESGVEEELFAVLSGYFLGAGGRGLHPPEDAPDRHVPHVLPEPARRLPRLSHPLHDQAPDRR